MLTARVVRRCVYGAILDLANLRSNRMHAHSVGWRGFWERKQIGHVVSNDLGPQFIKFPFSMLLFNLAQKTVTLKSALICVNLKSAPQGGSVFFNCLKKRKLQIKFLKYPLEQTQINFAQLKTFLQNFIFEFNFWFSVAKINSQQSMALISNSFDKYSYRKLIRFVKACNLGKKTRGWKSNETGCTVVTFEKKLDSEKWNNDCSGYSVVFWWKLQWELLASCQL